MSPTAAAFEGSELVDFISRATHKPAGIQRVREMMIALDNYEGNDIDEHSA